MVFEGLSAKFRRLPEDVRDVLEGMSEDLRNEAETNSEKMSRKTMNVRTAELVLKELKEAFGEGHFALINGANLMIRYDWQAEVDGSARHVKGKIDRPTFEFDAVTDVSKIQLERAVSKIKENLEKGSGVQLDWTNGRLKFNLHNIVCDMNVNGSKFNGIIPSEEIIATSQQAKIGDTPVNLASETMQVFAKMQVENRDFRDGSTLCARDISITVCENSRTIDRFVANNRAEIEHGLRQGYLKDFGVTTVEQFRDRLARIEEKIIPTKDPQLLRCMRDDHLFGSRREEIKDQLRDGHQRQRVRV